MRLAGELLVAAPLEVWGRLLELDDGTSHLSSDARRLRTGLKGSPRVDLVQYVSTTHSGPTHVDLPLIHAGIDPPVRNPMQSFVNELQLKSGRT